MIDTLKYTCHSDMTLEMQVLCEILISKKIPIGIIADFFTGKQREVFLICEYQWAKNREIDSALIAKEHDLTEILNTNGTFSETAIEKLRNLWRTRQYGLIIDQTYAIKDPLERLNKISELTAKCMMIKPVTEYNQNEQTCKLIEIIGEICSRKKNIAGLCTGIKAFDVGLNGFERGRLYVMGALKKTGKSRFLAFLCAKFSEQGANTIFNSLEMNEIQLNSLIVAHYSGIDSSKLHHEMPPREMEALNIGFSACNEMKWEIYREYTPENLRALIEYRMCKKKIDIVCVDFIQRMRVPHLKNDRVREVEYIAQRLADMSRELNICVIALSQLSGAAEHLEPDVCPNMSHYKESQGIPENADAIITIHNPDRNGTPLKSDNAGMITYEPLNFKIRIEQRYGISGTEIPIVADLRTCRFFGQDNLHSV